MAYLRQNHADVLDWLPYRADMSHIERLWDFIDKRVRQRPQPTATLPALRMYLFMFNIPTDLVSTHHLCPDVHGISPPYMS